MGRKINGNLSFVMECPCISDMIILSYLHTIPQCHYYREEDEGGGGGVLPIKQIQSSLVQVVVGLNRKQAWVQQLCFQGFSKRSNICQIQDRLSAGWLACSGQK